MRKVVLNDFLNNVILSNLKIAFDINIGLLTKKTLDLDSDTYIEEIMVFNTISNNLQPLDTNLKITSYEKCSGGFLLCVKGDEGSLLYKYDGEKIKLLTKIPSTVEEFGIINETIYYTSLISEDADSILCSQGIPFLKEGSKYVGGATKTLNKLDLVSGENKRLSSSEQSLRLFRISEAYGKIVFTTSSQSAKNDFVSYIYEYNHMIGQMTQLTNQNFRIDAIEILNDKQLVFEAVDLDQMSRNDNQQVYRLTIESQEINQSDFLDMSNEVPSIHSDMVLSKGQKTLCANESFYSIKTDRDKQIITIHNFSDNYQKISTNLIAIYGIESNGRNIWCVGAETMGLTELYEIKDGTLERVTKFNSWLDDMQLSIPEKVSIETDGKLIDGFVYPPIEKKHEQHPGVLMIHGGPKLMYSEIYNHDIQLLAAEGYYVFCANPSGSDGRGNAFLDIRGCYAELPYRQLMDFTDAVCEQFPLDKSLLGVTGGSYGAYMTNYIVTQTNRFKVAVSERGISNLMSAMTSSDIGMEYTMEYMDGQTPWDNFELYRLASPIYFADKVVTPMLFNHGRDDYRCLYAESLNLYSSLRHFQIDARLCIYPGENHSLVIAGKPKSKLRRYEEIIEWFKIYLKGAN